MREIKFRAWDYYEKKMYEVGGIDFFWGIIKLQWWHRTEDGMDRRKTKEIDMDIDKELHELFGVELMQYTGLKDKNGKEIYEGDICETVTVSGKPFGTIDVVKFINGSFQLVDIDDSLLPINLGDKDIFSVEVIGNILEHKDLLEEGEG